MNPFVRFPIVCLLYCLVVCVWFGSVNLTSDPPLFSHSLCLFNNVQCCATVLICNWPTWVKNVEFGNLISRKSCFWREIAAILSANLLFRWIFSSFSYKYFRFFGVKNNILDEHFDPFSGKCWYFLAVSTGGLVCSVQASHFFSFFNLRSTEAI